MKTWKMALLWALPMIAFMSLFYFLLEGSFTMKRFMINSIIFTVAGFAFAYGLKWWSNKTLKKIQIELPEGEETVKEGGANHFRGKEAVGGKLVLTNNWLLFASHKLNIQNHIQELHLSAVASVEAYKISGFISTGLKLHLKSGEVEKYVVNEPAEWQAAIQQLLSEQPVI